MGSGMGVAALGIYSMVAVIHAEAGAGVVGLLALLSWGCYGRLSWVRRLAGLE